MDEVLETLRNFLTCKKPVIKLAAVKTTIELVRDKKQEAIVPDLIKLLNDPAKIIRQEAKKGLETLAGKIFTHIYLLILFSNLCTQNQTIKPCD